MPKFHINSRCEPSDILRASDLRSSFGQVVCHNARFSNSRSPVGRQTSSLRHMEDICYNIGAVQRLLSALRKKSKILRNPPQDSSYLHIT